MPVALLGVTGCPLDECECVDEDGDGFCVDSCAGTLADCNDDNAFVIPGAADHHQDGFDFDSNGDDLGGPGAPSLSGGLCPPRKILNHIIQGVRGGFAHPGK